MFPVLPLYYEFKFSKYFFLNPTRILKFKIFSIPLFSLSIFHTIQIHFVQFTLPKRDMIQSKRILSTKPFNEPNNLEISGSTQRSTVSRESRSIFLLRKLRRNLKTK